AEDGIRDFHVTGVQTCALPIYALRKGHLAGYAVSGDILPGRIGNSVGGYGKPARRPRTLKQNSCQGAKAAETAGSAGRTDRRVEIGRASCRESGEMVEVAETSR